MNYLTITWEPNYELVATECEGTKEYRIRISRNGIRLDLTILQANDIIGALNVAQAYLNKYGRQVNYE